MPHLLDIWSLVFTMPHLLVFWSLVFTMKQYDLQPTRRYHSTRFIPGSLDTEAIQFSPQHYKRFLTCPQTLAGPLPPVYGTVIGSSSPFWYHIVYGFAELRQPYTRSRVGTLGQLRRCVRKNLDIMCKNLRRESYF